MLTRRRTTLVSTGLIGLGSILATLPATATAQTPPGHDRQASISATESRRAPDPTSGLDQLIGNHPTDMPAAVHGSIGSALAIQIKAAQLNAAAVAASAVPTPAVAPAPSPPPPPPVSDATSTDTADWQCIRIHESGDQYNSSVAPSGAYGLIPSTWASFGYTGWPYQAAASVQDGIALHLYNEFGWRPWSSAPACGL
jgi:hypothetical protein